MSTALHDVSPPRTRDLRPGETVRVRGAAEIFATLDERGMLDDLPFMPEMLKYCGRTFPVRHRADKTCAASSPGSSCRASTVTSARRRG